MNLGDAVLDAIAQAGARNWATPSGVRELAGLLKAASPPTRLSGTTILARTLGTSERTVQRWAKEGPGQTRSVQRSPFRPALQSLGDTYGFRQALARIAREGADVDMEALVAFSKDERRRFIARHIGPDQESWDGFIAAAQTADAGTAGRAFERTLWEEWGMDPRAHITDVAELSL